MMDSGHTGPENDWRLLDLGNAPLSFETARNVLLDPEYRQRAYTDVPYFYPTGGHAYMFLSSLPLCKLHPKFDPFKFLFLGKGFNKEFAVLKRYYHLKHNKTDLNKQLYSFQRHIYCLAVDECDTDSETLYLVHYFGSDYLLEDAPYRKNATIPKEMNKLHPTVSHSELPAERSAAPSDAEEHSTASSTEALVSPPSSKTFVTISTEPLVPTSTTGADSEANSPSEEFFPTMVLNSATKRKLQPAKPQPNKKQLLSGNNSTNKVAFHISTKNFHADQEMDNVDYLFAMNMAAQLQQLSKEMKAKVKFQIATVFYEAEMSSLNCSLD